MLRFDAEGTHLNWRGGDEWQWDLQKMEAVRIVPFAPEPKPAYADSRNPYDDGFAKVFSPSRDFVARLSYAKLEVWQATYTYPDPAGLCKDENLNPFRRLNWLYKTFSGNDDSAANAGMNLYWLDDSYLLVRPNRGRPTLLDVGTCKSLGCLPHVESPIYWFYRVDKTMFTSHSNGEIVAWDTEAIAQWCDARKKALTPMPSTAPAPAVHKIQPRSKP